MQVLVEEHGDGVGLHHVADAEGGHYGEDGKEYSQPLGLEPALEGVHRAAEDVPVFFDFYPVFYCQQGLGILRSHTEYAC